MIEVVQSPPAYNYGMNIPDIILRSDDPEVILIFSRKDLPGNPEIIRELYTPISTQDLVIKIKDLMNGILNANFPNVAGESGYAIHKGMFAHIGVVIHDGEHISRKEFDFKVVRGFLSNTFGDVSRFWTYQWLSVSFHREILSLYDPRFLTFVSEFQTEIYADVYFVDNSLATRLLAHSQSDSVTSVDVSPSKIQRLYEKQVLHYQVYGRRGSEDTIRKHQIVVDRFSDELVRDRFIYLNRLGGWDTLILLGQSTIEYKPLTENALFGDKTNQYYTSPDATTAKNGYVLSTQHKNQIIEFLLSEQRYHYRQGIPESIVLIDPQGAFTSMSLNQIEIKFAYSDKNHNYPQLEYTPSYLIS